MSPIQEFKPDIQFEELRRAVREKLSDVVVLDENVIEEEQTGQETVVYTIGSSPSTAETIVLFGNKFTEETKNLPAEDRSHQLVGSRALIENVKAEVYGIAISGKINEKGELI